MLIAHLGARDQTEGDVAAATPSLSGISIDGSWDIFGATYQDTATTRYVSSYWALAKAAASPGTGTIQFNWAGECFSVTYDLYEVTQGFALPLSGYQEAVNGVEATSGQLTVTPAASTLAFSGIVINGDPTAPPTQPTGYTLETEVAQSVNHTSYVAWKLGSAAANPTWTTLDDNKRATMTFKGVLQDA